MKKVIFFLLVLNILGNSESKSQNCERCNAALTKDRLVSTTNVFEAISFLEKISRTEYDELKINANAGFSVPIPLVGNVFDFIKGSANYDQFQSKLRDYKSEVQSQYNYILNYNVEEVRTNPIAYKYWSECMSSCNEIRGLQYWLAEETPGIIYLSLKYVPSPDSRQRTLRYTVRVDTEDSSYRLTGTLVANAEGNTERLLRKYRANKSTTTVTVNGGGFNRTKTYTYILNNKLKVSNISLSYTHIDENTKNGEAQTSPDAHENRVPNIGNLRQQLAGRTVPNPTNANVPLPFPISCDREWFHSWLQLTVSADKDYTFVGTPSAQENLECMGGACAWNAGQIGNGTCGDGRKSFVVSVDNPTYKVIYLNVGSGPTTYRLKNIKQRKTTTIEENIPFFNSENNETVFTIDRNKINDGSVKIDFLDSSLPAVVKVSTLIASGQAVLVGNTYRVSLSNIQKNNLLAAVH